MQQRLRKQDIPIIVLSEQQLENLQKWSTKKNFGQDGKDMVKFKRKIIRYNAFPFWGKQIWAT